MFIEEWLLEKLLRERQAQPGPLLKIPFYRVESVLFQKTEQELRAYDMPITKIIEENSVKDLARETDDHLLEALGYAYDKLWGNK